MARFYTSEEEPIYIDEPSLPIRVPIVSDWLDSKGITGFKQAAVLGAGAAVIGLGALWYIKNK